MTASLYATTSRLYAVASAAGTEGSTATAPGPRHAVSRPVVDGLTASECGLLVEVSADRDWLDVPDAARCAECARVAG
ncbi:hypothetical protein [Trujillonella humicola]|uniref:hypothetical protein n=1 Tax=Trujillonella humicola TaxID=3383699 RepID=UPI003905C85D